MGDGRIGRLLGARCYSTCGPCGGEIEPELVFAEDPYAGVNLVIIQGAHALDLCIALAGELADLSAMADRQYPEPTVIGANRTVRRATFDHLVTQSRLACGGTLATETVGGRPAGETPFRLEMTGERGTIALTGGALRGFQSGDMELTIDGAAQPIDAGELAGLPEPAVNVAGVYAALRDDIVDGGATAPDFVHAVRLARLIEDALAASKDGRRREPRDWPIRGGVGDA